MRMRFLLLWMSIFAISMGFFESAVVIYLREILYPEGFSFPLQTIEGSLALTELLRELSTLLILGAASVVAGNKFSTRFAWFLYSFAIWDIFYYVFLKLMIGWPASLLDWDILFLIPATWTGPVISPLIVCMVMIALSVTILLYARKGYKTTILTHEWIMLFAGAFIIVLAFIWDYSSFILDRFSLSEIWNFPLNDSLLEYASGYIPEQFSWGLFSLGIAGLSLTVLFYALRVRSENTQKAL